MPDSFCFRSPKASSEPASRHGTKPQWQREQGSGHRTGEGSRRSEARGALQRRDCGDAEESLPRAVPRGEVEQGDARQRPVRSCRRRGKRGWTAVEAPTTTYAAPLASSSLVPVTSCYDPEVVTATVARKECKSARRGTHFGDCFADSRRVRGPRIAVLACHGPSRGSSATWRLWWSRRRSPRRNPNPALGWARLEMRNRTPTILLTPALGCPRESDAIITIPTGWARSEVYL